MRIAVTWAVMLLFSSTRVFAANAKAPNAHELVKLEARAAQARPQDQCLLYAELVEMATDLAVAQIQSGSEDQALATIASVESYASRIDLRHSKTARKLKNAEILLGQAAFRLRELLMGAPLEDRPSLERALKRVNVVQSALLLQVFAR